MNDTVTGGHTGNHFRIVDHKYTILHMNCGVGTIHHSKHLALTQHVRLQHTQGNMVLEQILKIGLLLRFQ